MVRAVKIATVSILAFLAVLLIIIMPVFPFVGDFAIAMNDGGIMAAAGHWKVYSRGKPIISPMFFMVLGIIFSLITLAVLPGKKTGFGKESFFHFVPFTILVTFMILTTGCILTRYLMWHAMIR